MRFSNPWVFNIPISMAKAKQNMNLKIQICAGKEAKIIFVVFSRIFFCFVFFLYFISSLLCDFLELEKMSKPSLLSASDLHRVHTMAIQQESSTKNSGNSSADNDKRKKNKYLRSAMSMDTRSTPIETPTTSATSATAVTSSMSRSSSGSKVGGSSV